MDFKGAFGSAWWPAILKVLREAKCPRKLYYLAKDYLKERKVAIAIHGLRKDKNKQMTVRNGHAVAQSYGTPSLTPF